MDTKQLRLNGYMVDDRGHLVCHRDDARFVQERVALIRIDSTNREIVDKLIEIADSPRALIGRSRSGAVLLFKLEGTHSIVPRVLGDNQGLGVFKLADRVSREPLTIAIRSVGESLDVSAYSWPKGRDPLSIRRDSLPALTHDVGGLVMAAAMEFCTWASIVELDRQQAERVAKFKADLASGAVQILTDEERQAAEDERIVRENAGREIFESDGLWTSLILAARSRLQSRKAKATPTPSEREHLY